MRNVPKDKEPELIYSRHWQRGRKHSALRTVCVCACVGDECRVLNDFSWQTAPMRALRVFLPLQYLA